MCNVEWNVPSAKIKMNEISTPATVSWILKDNATGKQLNRTNILEMKLGDIKKIRLYNDPNSAHPMRASNTYPWTTFLRYSIRMER